MKRGCRKETVYGRKRPLRTSLQASPRIRHGGIDRQQARSEPSGQLLLEPVTELLFPLARRKLLDTSPQFAEREHAEMQCFVGDFLEPRGNGRSWLRTRELGDDVGVDEITHRRTSRGGVRSRVKSSSTPLSGELRMKSMNRLGRFFRRR